MAISQLYQVSLRCYWYHLREEELQFYLIYFKLWGGFIYGPKYMHKDKIQFITKTGGPNCNFL